MSVRDAKQGPFLSALLLCDRILVEQDGTKSAIRIIDRITRNVSAEAPPETMATFTHDLSLLVRFKSGWARGTFPLKVVLVRPSGDNPPPLTETVLFEGEEDRGVDVVMNFTMEITQVGIYWFEIYLADEFISKIPLRVVYIPRAQTPARG